MSDSRSRRQDDASDLIRRSRRQRKENGPMQCGRYEGNPDKTERESMRQKRRKVVRDVV